MVEQRNREEKQLGNYRLERLLGRGGFAEVYLGQHQRLGRQAAIKVLHAYLSEKEIDAFQREAQIIATLDHPNIIRILDFDVQNGVPFLVMDYLPNGMVRQRHHRGDRSRSPRWPPMSSKWQRRCTMHMSSGSFIGMSSRRTCSLDGAMRSSSATSALRRLLTAPPR